MALKESTNKKINTKPFSGFENPLGIPDTLAHLITGKLPFDIQVSQRGYALKRLGHPYSSDDGTRIFVVGKEQLDKFYQENHENGDSPEALYMFLKKFVIYLK